jgi:vitamin B12 transporter
LFIFSFWSFSFFGQDSTRVLRTVPIQQTATFNTQDAFATIPHFKLSKEWLMHLGAADVAEALKYSPGIQLKDYGGIGGVRTIAYRGLGAGHTGVMIDGQMVPNIQTGITNLNGFDLFGVSAVSFTSGEVLDEKASATAYLNPNTISVSTLIYEKPDSLKLGYYGVLNTIHAYENGLYLQLPIGEKCFVATQIYNKFGSGQYSFVQPEIGINVPQVRSHTRLNSARGRVVFGADYKHGKLRFSGQFSDTDQELPGAVVLYNPSNDQYLWINEQRFVGDYNWQKLGWQLNTKVAYNRNITEYLDNHVLNEQGYTQAKYLQENYKAGFISKKALFKDQLKIFAGADLWLTTLEAPSISTNPKRWQNNAVLGAKWRNKRVQLSANLTHQSIHDQFTIDQTIVKTTENYAGLFASASYLPFQKDFIKIRAFFKENARIPSFNDLYYNAIGNPNLKPEEARLVDIGLTFLKKWRKIKLSVTVDGYANIVRNKIIAIPTKDLFNWSMQNIGIAEIRGADMNAFVTWSTKKMTWTLNTSHALNSSIDGTNSESPTYGHQLPYIPQYTGSGGLIVGLYDFQFNVNVLYSSFRYSLNENIYANYLEGYTDVNLGLSKIFTIKSSTLNVAVKCMNVLNKNYQLIRSYPMPGRYYQFRVQYDL